MPYHRAYCFQREGESVRNSQPISRAGETVTVRTDLKPGDIGAIVRLHGVLYSQEYGFDPTFEAYVAGPLSEFVRAASPLERLWVAEQGGRIVGSIAIVQSSPGAAQLRWFLVDPYARGAGLGRRLLKDAIEFSRSSGYRTIVLWTVSALESAAHLYTSSGFKKVEEIPGRRWGVDVTEERYDLDL